MATTRHTFRPHLESLEDRRTPSVLYALNAAGTALLRFNSAAPAALTNVAPVLGLQPGEALRGIDFRPRTGQLYGLGITDTPGPDTGRLYQLNGLTGVATPVAAGAAPFSTTLADGASYGFDFNPVADVIRVINSAGQNLRVSPTTGLSFGTDTNLTAGSMVVGSAYDRNFEGTPLTTLFGINLAGSSLVLQGGVNGVPSPNGGVITPVGPLGVTPDNGNVGFDIQGGSNTAFAALTVSGVTRLFTVNLTTGAATPVGAIGTGAGGVLGLAVVPDGILVFGPDSGPRPHQKTAPLVRVFDALTQTLKFDILAFRRKFKGGVRVGSGDVNRDGIPDILTGPGAGVRPHVKVFDGLTGALIYDFRAFGPHYTLGIYVAGGDVNNDGFDDIIVGTAEGGGHVKVFSGRDLTLLHSFLAYGKRFKGGVRVGAGDVNGDRVADILTGPGEGRGTRLKVFSGVDLTLLRDFVVYGPKFKGGLQVTTAFIDGDNRADIVTGPGVGGHGNFRVTRAVDDQLISGFLAYGPTYKGGLRVGAVDVNGDGRADVLGGPTPDRISQTVVFDPLTQTRLSSFVVYDPSFTGGLFVGAGR